MAEDSKGSLTGTERRLAWQGRLLPVMIGMLATLTLFFFIASFIQLFYLHKRIADAPPPQELTQVVASLLNTKESAPSPEIHKLTTAAALESNIVARRYHQANIELMSRVWVQYLGFVTGMMLALVGAAFVLGQLRSPESEISSTSGALPFAMRTASPGLILCVLGVVLMIATIITHHDIQTTDISVYFDNAFTGKGAGVPIETNLNPNP